MSMEVPLLVFSPLWVAHTYVLVRYIYDTSFYYLFVRLLMLLMAQYISMLFNMIQPMVPTFNDSIISLCASCTLIYLYAAVWTILYRQPTVAFYQNVVFAYWFFNGNMIIVNAISRVDQESKAMGLYPSNATTLPGSTNIASYQHCKWRFHHMHYFVHVAEFGLSWTILHLLRDEPKVTIYTLYCLLTGAIILVLDGTEAAESVCAISLPITFIKQSDVCAYHFISCFLLILYATARKYASEDILGNSLARIFDDALGCIPKLTMDMLSLIGRQEKNNTVLHLINICAALLYSENAEQLMDWSTHALSVELSTPLILINNDAVFSSGFGADMSSVEEICSQLRADSHLSDPTTRMSTRATVELVCRMYKHPKWGRYYVYIGSYYIIVAVVLQVERVKDFIEIASRTETYIHRAVTFFADCSGAANAILDGHMQLMEMEESWRSFLDTSRKPFYTFWNESRARILSLKSVRIPKPPNAIHQSNRQNVMLNLLDWAKYICIVADMFRLGPISGFHYELQRKKESPLNLSLLEIYGSRVMNAECKVIAKRKVKERFGLLQFFMAQEAADAAVLEDMLRMDMAIYHTIMSYISSSFVLPPFHGVFECRISHGSLCRKLELSDILASHRNSELTIGKTRKVESCSELVSYIDELTNEIILISSQCVLSFRAWFSVVVNLPISKVQLLNILEGTTHADSSLLKRNIIHNHYSVLGATHTPSTRSLDTEAYSSVNDNGLALLDSRCISSRVFLSAVHALNLIICFTDVSECCIYIPDYLSGQTSVL